MKDNSEHRKQGEFFQLIIYNIGVVNCSQPN